MCADPSDSDDSAIEPRKRPRQGRSKQMREDLLDGATRVLAERGARGLTTNHVAQAAGASIGSLYQYFPNKKALLAALHAREARALWLELEGVLADDTLPPGRRLEAVVVTCCQAQAADADLEQAMVAAGVESTATVDFGELREDVLAALAWFIEEQCAAEPAEARRLSESCFLFLSAAMLHLVHHPGDAETLGRDTARAMRGLLDLPEE